MRALIIGATGYVGSAIARKFKARGWETHGLSRSDDNVVTLRQAGLLACPGDLTDLASLKTLVRDFDIVVQTAPVAREMEPAVASAIIEGCQAGDGRRHFIFTSGTGVVSHESRDGSWSDVSYSDYDDPPIPGVQMRALRVVTEQLVRHAASDQLNAAVIRPPLIYGLGRSMQVPAIFVAAKRTGAACYIGHGLNLYSNVHVDDLAEMYCLIVERGVPGALYHAVSGEANFRQIAEAAAGVIGCEARSVTFDEACGIWGEQFTVHAFAVNSRSTSPRSRHDLGWQPKAVDLIEDIRNGSYRQVMSAGTAS